jgi:hypothetical protein
MNLTVPALALFVSSQCGGELRLLPDPGDLAFDRGSRGAHREDENSFG